MHYKESYFVKKVMEDPCLHYSVFFFFYFNIKNQYHLSIIYTRFLLRTHGFFPISSPNSQENFHSHPQPSRASAPAPRMTRKSNDTRASRIKYSAIPLSSSSGRFSLSLLPLPGHQSREETHTRAREKTDSLARAYRGKVPCI